MIVILMTVQLTETLSVTALPLGISDMTLGIIVAFIFGCIIFVVKYDKQCCDNVKWIIEICKMNFGKAAEEKEQKSNVDSSVKEISKEEIAEIKEDISNLSQQIKTTLAEIKQIRKTQILKALEDDIRTASTEYAMKFELKKPEYDKAMRILQVSLVNMPEEAVVYNEKVTEWIAKAQKKFNEYSPEHFVQNVETIRARREVAEKKQARGK